MELDDFDARLDDWAELQAKGPATGLLLGNGASRAIWRNFAYDSLFELAQKVRNKPLGLTDLALFKSMGSQNFEQVLGALNSAVRVNAALAISSTSPLNRYYAIKEALIHAMRSVHIPWKLIDPATLAVINGELRRYASVYSGNYDLLCHWAVRHAPEGLDELLDDDTGFDVRRTASSASRVLYLHGGLHLIKNSDGTTRRRSATGSALLDGFAINTPGDVPLFVNEGRNEDKLRAVRDSDYLNWCHGELSHHRGGLCLFGHQLNPQDDHILQALRQARPERLMVSIFPLSDAWIINQKQRYSRLLADCTPSLEFFDATTHPLGRPELSVAVEKAVKKRR